jgi:ATP-binding cassette subfamily C (CFTR/MRP) protein 2
MGFFDATPLGRVLSRFSSDFIILDVDIPFIFFICMISTMNVYSSLGVLVVVTWQVVFRHSNELFDHSTPEILFFFC